MLINSKPLKCLKAPFVRQWVVCGLPSLCPFGLSVSLWCSLLITWFHRSCPLMFSIFVVTFFLNMSMDAAQMETLSFDCTPTFIFPTLSYTHTNFLPIPRMHMPFHTAFLLQTLFPLPGMTFSSRRTPSSCVTGSFSLNTLVRHLCGPSRGCYVIVSLSVPCLTSAPRTPKFWVGPGT